MSPGSSVVLPMILTAIGIGCVILSFLVPDRKKSLISLGLALLIILTGIIQIGSGAISRYLWNQRLKSIQRDRQADFEVLREKMKEKAGEAKPAAAPAKN